MKHQRTVYSCGAATVVNALRTFGVKVNEFDVIRVAGTTRVDGTNEHGIMAALRHYGLRCQGYSSNNRDHGWSWLHGTILHGSRVILCSDAWQHWVLVTGVSGDEVTMVDPARFKCNLGEHLTHVVGKNKVMRRWWNARMSVEGEKRLYAIKVSR